MMADTAETKSEPRILGITRRVWIGLGIGLLLTMSLAIWAVVAGVSWLWGQVPDATEAGKRAAGMAIEQVEKSTPGAREQLRTWLPGLIKEEPAAAGEKSDTARQP